jgi:hypothetical protein
MNPIKSFYLLILFTLFNCTDEYNIELPNDEPQVVIDGWIRTDQPPFVAVSKSFASNGSFTYDDDGIKKNLSIENALVIIADDENHIDTLKYSINYSYYTWKEVADLGSVTKSNHITLSAGHNYFLTVVLDSKKYTSNAFMQPVPRITDIGYVVRKGEVGKDDQHIPLISFNKIIGKEHFYLISLSSQDDGESMDGFHSIQYNAYGGGRVWPMSVIRDSTLPEAVKDLPIDDGVSIARYSTWYPIFNGGARVYLYSIPEEVYQYYKALLQQFDNDGGTYSPSPASPTGNINGALGLFNASDVSTAQVSY